MCKGNNLLGNEEAYEAWQFWINLGYTLKCIKAVRKRTALMHYGNGRKK